MKNIQVLAIAFVTLLVTHPAVATVEDQCFSNIQGKIPWSANGNKNWSPTNVKKLCRGTSNPTEPGRCFKRVMFGNVNWGNSTKWQWKNALDLCAGTSSANSTISCFQAKINRGQNWKPAIQACKGVVVQGAPSSSSTVVVQGGQSPTRHAVPSGKTATITPAPIKGLVPLNLTRGDREFGGNGPDIYCKVVLRVDSNRRDILADVHFRASETKSDWSTVEDRFTRKVFTAPRGRSIDRILSPTTSVVEFRSKPAGFQLLVPGEDFARFWNNIEKLALEIASASTILVGVDLRGSPQYREAERQMLDIAAGKRDLIFRGNHVHNRTPASGPVALFSIVGDTGGNDISTDTNGKDDTRIEAITFRKINIRYR